MGALTADYLDAIGHLPPGATLTLYKIGWDQYEHLRDEIGDRPGVRTSFDSGKLEIMTTSPEHEEYASFIDALVRVLCDVPGVNLQSYGRTTWMRPRLQKGAEPDACYYVTNANRVIGRRVDPSSEAPDIVVEVDISHESLNKFQIYAVLGVGEIWRYDGEAAHFYQLSGGEYRELSESPSFAGFTPKMLADALDHSKREGQTAALQAFRSRWRASRE